MTTEPSYQHIGDFKDDYLDSDKAVAELLGLGVLVPDGRLEAIADAWKRYRYLQARSLNPEVQDARWKAEALLDALAGDDTA